MRKPQRFHKGLRLLDVKAFDLISFGEFKGRTIGWMADNAPLELEAWASSRKGYFSKEITERIENAKNLLR